jgi:pimeloyl-ACP methyl ester carboxylesterase
VPGSANTKIGGRDVIITYPCNKHEGARVTFILNLHGTMMDESLKFYQHGYFAAYALASSHNLIVAEPKSVVSQWGNGDNGQDKPHLYEVIDWVYSNFGTKFKIAGLWVAGHSWGSMFAKTFACDDKLKERVRGVIGMSGGATGVGSGIGGFTGGGGASTAGCADRVSQIHTVGDQEAGATGGVPDQTAVATKHGCQAKMGPKDIGNMQMLTEWPSCSPGWAHFNFVMGAHQHTTPINPEVVKYIIEGVKKTETK